MNRIFRSFLNLAASFSLVTFAGAMPGSAAAFRQSYCLRMAGGNVDPNPVCYRSNRMCLNMRDRQIQYWRRTGVTITASCAINLR